jgi:hypothetical protein
MPLHHRVVVSIDDGKMATCSPAGLSTYVQCIRVILTLLPRVSPWNDYVFVALFTMSLYHVYLGIISYSLRPIAVQFLHELGRHTIAVHPFYLASLAQRCPLLSADGRYHAARQRSSSTRGSVCRRNGGLRRSILSTLV